MSDTPKPDAERARFEAFHGQRKSKGVAWAERRFDRLPDGTYADDSVQRHWWTWKNAVSRDTPKQPDALEPVTVFSRGPWLFEETGQRFTGAELDAEAFAKYRAALAAQAEKHAATLDCGHPASLLLHSAETGLPLYCELCDARSGRRDAEAMEVALRAQVDAWQALYRRAINEANGLTNYVEDRPELRSAEKRLAAIEAAAHKAIDSASKGQTPEPTRSQP